MSRVMTRPLAEARRACAWRCRRLPLAITFLPLAGLECFAGGRPEWALLGASALCGLGGVCLGTQAPQRRALAALSVALAGWAAWDMARAALLLVGLVAASHLLNARLCRACPSCHPAPAEKGVTAP